MPLFAALTEAALFDAQSGHAAAHALEAIVTVALNGAGMLPGWDQYGNCAPELKTCFAYLSRKTNDPTPLAAIVAHGMWSENELLAWYNDDKVWTLVFWPEQFDGSECPPRPHSWLNPPVCGKLISSDGTIDLLQMWDHIEAGRPGRAHINPNNLEICTHGALHTADGQGAAADMSYFQYRDGMSFAAAHSVVLVDDRGYEFPDHAWHGNGECRADLPSLKALRGDVSDLYRELWNVRTMKRTTLLIGDRLILLCDSFAADQPHTYTWQMMLRPNVATNGNRARQILREGTVLDIAAPDNCEFRTQEINGYPRGLEQRTHRLWFERQATGCGCLPVVMRPDPGTRLIRDLSDGWSLTDGGEAMPECPFDEQATHINLHSEAIHPPILNGTAWFAKCCHLAADEATRATRLSIKRGQVDRLEVWGNGIRAPELFEHPSIQPGCRDVHKPDGRFWPSHFDFSGLLRTGENHIAIASSEFRGQTLCGPIKLLQLAEPPELPLTVAECGDYLRITDAETEWLVIPNNETHDMIGLPGGIETDAEIAVVNANCLTVVGTQNCRLPEFTLVTESPVDLEFATDRLTIARRTDQPFSARLDCAAGSFTIGPEGPEGEGALPWEVCITPCVIQEKRDLGTGGPSLPPQSHAAAPPNRTGLPRNISPYDVGFLAGETENPRQALTQALAADNWRTRLAAVECIGEQGCTWAMPLLLDLLAKEPLDTCTDPGWGNWPFAKMKTTFVGWTDPTLSEEARRGHRLKTVILETLGKLGDPRAEEAIAAILERQTDFYPTLVQAIKAAEALELTGLLEKIEALTDYYERNTREAARAATARLR